jgi:hypothetical protein
MHSSSGFSELFLAIAYITLHVIWPSVYCGRVDPWLRTKVGKRLGVRVVWMPGTVPRSRSWTWGIDPAEDTAKGALVRAVAMIVWWAGAMLPTAALTTLIFGGWISARVGAALAPLSMVMAMIFLHRLSRMRPAPTSK